MVNNKKNETFKNDKLIDQVESELEDLKGDLRDRLEETIKVKNIEELTLSKTKSLTKETKNLEENSIWIKYKWIWEYWKWFIIAGGLILILIFVFKIF